MKLNLLLFAFLTLVFSGCSNMKKLESYSNDDVYLDPKNDREVFYPKPIEKSEPVVFSNKIAASKEDSLNPYYKDKDFSYDDYYDNEYAARLKRFHDPMYGVGYYDSYYTNSYFYNQNPYQYGVSIYNGYNFWPSYNNYSYVPTYNWGMNFGYGTNYGYNPYGYNSWYNPNYYNGWNNWCGNWSNPYSPYGYGMNPYAWGYNNGYNNGFYNGYNYGYNNSLDYNSGVYYGPRASHSGYTSNHQPVNASGAKMTVNKPEAIDYSGVSPASTERFNQIKVPEAVKNKAVTKGGGSNNLNTGRPNTNAGNSGYDKPVMNHSTIPGRGLSDNENNNGSSSPKGNVIKPENEPKKNSWGIFNESPKGGNMNENQGRPIKPADNSGYEPPVKGGFQNSQPGKGNFEHPSNNNNNNSGSPRSTSGGGVRPR